MPNRVEADDLGALFGSRESQDGPGQSWTGRIRASLLGSPAAPASACWVLAVLGTLGEWVTFPLSPAISGRNVTMPLGETFVPVTIGLSGLLLVALVVALLSRGTALVLGAAALALWALVPIQIAAFEPSWLQAYLVESSARSDLAEYLHEHFVANRSPEPGYVAMVRFDGLAEQLKLGVVMLGWGYYLTGAAVVGLLVVLGSKSLWGDLLLSLGVCCVFLGAAGGGSLWELLGSERAQTRGDRLLARGEPNGALEAYREALVRNPPLRLSPPFLQKLSACYAGWDSRQDPLAELNNAFELANRENARLEPTPRLRARDSLRAILTGEAAGATGVEGPLFAAAQRIDSELWLTEGRSHAKAGDFSQALGSYAQAAKGEAPPLLVFYRAHAQLVLGDPDLAIALLPQLVGRVGQGAFRADILCTLGDAYTLKGDLARARDNYRACRDADRVDNFRALRALGGG